MSWLPILLRLGQQQCTMAIEAGYSNKAGKGDGARFFSRLKAQLASKLKIK